MLQDYTKTRIRVHMGVPVLGLQNSGFALGYRFENQIGLLEYRMTNLQPYEEISITGVPAASAAVYGQITLGDVLNMQITPSDRPPILISYTVQPSDLVAPQGPMAAVAQNFANAIMQTPSGASFVQAAYSPGVTQPYPTAIPPNASVILQGIFPVPFTITTYVQGYTTFQPTLQGVLPAPSVTFKEDAVTIYGYVPIADYLQGKLFSSSDLMKFTKADVVNFRHDELGARRAVYDEARQQLAEFLGIPLFPVPPVDNSGGANVTGLRW